MELKHFKLLPLHIFMLYTPNELNHALILRCCMHVWWNLFKTPQMVWARVLLQEPIHDQMPWHRIPGPIQQAGNCLHKSWLNQDYSKCVKEDLEEMLGTMKPFWFVEIENHKSWQIMLHYDILSSACATVVSVQLSLSSCIVVRVHSFCNSTVRIYRYKIIGF